MARGSLDAQKALMKLGQLGPYQLIVFTLAQSVWMFYCSQSMLTAFVSDSNRCENKSGDNSTVACEGGSIVTEWHLVANRAWLAELGNCGYFLGVLLGSLLVTHFADRFGRRPVLLVSVWSMGVLGFISAFSPSYPFFVIARLATGITAGSSSVVGWVLACEMMVTSKRYYGAIWQAFMWTGSYCFTGLVAWLCADWRDTVIVVSAPTVILISYYWVLPESLHWYAAKGKIEEAENWIQKAAKFNKVTVDLNECYSEKTGTEKKKRNLFSICSNTLLFVQTAIMAYLWLCNTFLYYGLSLVSTRLAGDRYLNYFLSGIIELPARLIMAPFLSLIGRRMSVCIVLTLAGVSQLALLFISSSSYPWAYLVVWLGAKFAASSANMALWLYAAELFPTTVRTAAVGVCNVLGRLGATLSPLARELYEINATATTALFGGSCLLAGIVSLLLPETRGVQLVEDIDQIDPGPVLGKIFKNRESSV